MNVVVDCGLGNLGSICNMARRAGQELHATSEAAVIMNARKIILPGVGAFDYGMQRLSESGLLPVLEKKVLQEAVPVLGICLGMQMLTESSAEGKRAGLGWIKGRTVKFATARCPGLKIPHMGWNGASVSRNNPLFTGLETENRFYFVHSYHVVCDDASDVLALTHYGQDFPSAVNRGNIFGVQFHPEKSHRFGMRLLKNFLEMK